MAMYPLRILSDGKSTQPPPPTGGQSYCAFVFGGGEGRGEEVKEENISLKFGHLVGKTDIMVYREVTLLKTWPENSIPLLHNSKL